MKNELKKRILTSIFLIGIVLTCILINPFICLGALIIISFICWLEFNSLLKKIFNKKKVIQLNLLKFISLIYLILFTIITFYFNLNSKYLLIFFILVCAFSDIGGYVIGKTFKGKKLTKISPNKTWSGMYGSFLFSTIPVMIFYVVFITLNDLPPTTYFFKNILLSLYLSLICQLGDLFISYFKRLAKVKDTGNILPGHGGLLDRIDGMVFAIPSIIIFFI